MTALEKMCIRDRVTAQGLPVIIVTSILLGIVTKGTVPVLQTLLVEPVTDPQAYDDLFAVNTFARGSTNILTLSLIHISIYHPSISGMGT